MKLRTYYSYLLTNPSAIDGCLKSVLSLGILRGEALPYFFFVVYQVVSVASCRQSGNQASDLHANLTGQGHSYLSPVVLNLMDYSHQVLPSPQPNKSPNILKAEKSALKIW